MANLFVPPGIAPFVMERRIRAMQAEHPDESLKVYEQHESGPQLIDVLAPKNRYYGGKDAPSSG